MASHKWFLAAVYFALANTGWSQRTSGWRVYRIPDGLPSSACASVTVGLNGKILATHITPDAVTELDGYDVRNYSGPGPPGSRVCESPGGQLWAMTPSGLKEWKNNTWVLHTVPEIAEAMRGRTEPSGPSLSFLPVQHGRVLFLLPDRLMEFNVEELNRPRTMALRAATRTQLESFSGMSLARDGGLWIAGRRGLARAPSPARSLKPADDWQEYIPPASLGLQNFREPREDADGGVTLIADSAAAGQTVAVYFDGSRWTAYPPGAGALLHAWRGPDGVMRGMTTDSLWQWQNDRFVETDEIAARHYFDVAVEPGGAFWLATSDGLFRYALPAWRIPAAIENIVSHVRGVAGDAAGRIWFVANGRLHSLQNEVHQEYALPEAIQNSPAWSLFPLKSGALLLAARDSLVEFHPENGRFNTVRAANPNGRLAAPGTVRDGGVCVQSFANGAKEMPTLEVFDGARFQPFPGPPPESTPGELFSVLFAAQNGDLWLGGVRGAALRHDGKWQAFVSTDKTTPENVVSFAELADGKIWCAAPDKIWEFDGKNWLAVRGGFDRLSALVRGGDGSVWAATDSGLHRFWQGAWIENGLEEGLPGASVYEVCEDQQGRIWAATSRGLCRYFPDADLDAPRTATQKLSDQNEPLLEGGTLNVLFSSRDKWKFTPRDRLLFSYRLDQHDWSAFQEWNGVSFPDLPAGKHYLQVRAMDRNGNIENPTQLEFAVSLPWYRETRLLLISCAGLATALFFAALSFNRHRKLLRSYAEVERQVAARTRELEVANRELLHSQKMNALGTLAAGIAHDFNNILSIIKGSAQIIEEDPANSEKVRTRLDRIKTVVEQGSGIVKAMLGFSRDSGEAERFDPNSVVEDTLKLLGDRFLREVEVKTKLAAGLPEVQTSRDFIQQILLNFLFNAAESMTGRKLVTIATERITKLPPGVVLPPPSGEGYVAISVRDAGCGIPAENLSRIFEPFFTTKSLSARRGTGLGLSMVYELAKKMEAGLAVESVVDEGSVFALILPVREKTQ